MAARHDNFTPYKIEIRFLFDIFIIEGLDAIRGLAFGSRQTWRLSYRFSEVKKIKLKKSARFEGTFSSRAQLASLASLSAPRARDSIVALRAPFFLDLALRARSCALRIHLILFLIFWYWSSNQFYNNITDYVNYTFSQSHWISFWI